MSISQINEHALLRCVNVNVNVNLYSALSQKPPLMRTSVHFVKSRTLKCSLNAPKCGFYRAANSIFGKIGRIASEEVVYN